MQTVVIPQKKWKTHREEDESENDQYFNRFEPRSAFDR
jgi:hypothetical protein